MSAYRDIQIRSGAVDNTVPDIDPDCWACRKEITFTLDQVKHLLFVKYGLEKTADSEWAKNVEIMRGYDE